MIRKLPVNRLTEAETRVMLMDIEGKLIHLWRHGRGATAIEYGLIAAGIALVIIAAIALVGGSLSNLFNDLSSNL